ncbi:MAG: GtrA family protein [Steroidobacteraceae bacterium]
METLPSPRERPLERVPAQTHLRQLGRFCGVGLTCLIISLAVLVGLHTFAGMNYLFAYIVSFIAGNLAGYVLNAHFTFSVSTITHGGAIRYMGVNGALLCVSTAVMRLMVGEFHIWYLAAALATAAVNTPVSFLVQRIVTYGVTVVGSARHR